jgi:hypothetical protein
MGLQRSNVSVNRTPGGIGVPDRLTVTVSNYQFRFFTPLIAGTKTAKPIDVTLPMENP